VGQGGKASRAADRGSEVPSTHAIHSCRHAWRCRCRCPLLPLPVLLLPPGSDAVAALAHCLLTLGPLTDSVLVRLNSVLVGVKPQLRAVARLYRGQYHLREWWLPGGVGRRGAGCEAAGHGGADF